MDRSTRVARTYTVEMVQAHHGGTITYTPTGPKLSGIPCLNPKHPGDNNSRSAYIVTSKEGNPRAICETHKCPWRDTNDAIRQSLGVQTWNNQNQIQNHPQPRIVAAYHSPDQRPPSPSTASTGTPATHLAGGPSTTKPPTPGPAITQDHTNTPTSAPPAPTPPDTHCSSTGPT